LTQYGTSPLSGTTGGFPVYLLSSSAAQRLSDTSMLIFPYCHELHANTNNFFSGENNGPRKPEIFHIKSD